MNRIWETYSPCLKFLSVIGNEFQGTQAKQVWIKTVFSGFSLVNALIVFHLHMENIITREDDDINADSVYRLNDFDKLTFSYQPKHQGSSKSQRSRIPRDNSAEVRKGNFYLDKSFFPN